MVVSNCVEKIQMSQEVKQLREINEKLREVKQVKERFIAITSHELRTPVSHIKSYLDFLEDPDFPEEEKKSFFEIVKKSVLDLERIVTDMFEVSQVENRQLSFNKEPGRLNEVVADCLKQLSVDLMKRELNIDHDETIDVPQMLLDPFQIKKVFMEILNNSIRFTPDGGSINIFYKVSDNVIKLVVKDTGIGIPAGKIGTIFEKFYEVQDSNYHTSSKIDFMGGSTGIGLPLAKGLVEAHGGRIKVESKENEGTTVLIYFKRKAEDQTFINSYEKVSTEYS
jgi:signal transduction histidine kinase